jgi:hypothetical protein
MWDGEILIATHGDTSRCSGKECAGDGVKKMVIRLKNETNNSETMGGGFTAEYYGGSSLEWTETEV